MACALWHVCNTTPGSTLVPPLLDASGLSPEEVRHLDALTKWALVPKLLLYAQEMRLCRAAQWLVAASG